MQILEIAEIVLSFFIETKRMYTSSGQTVNSTDDLTAIKFKYI